MDAVEEIKILDEMRKVAKEVYEDNGTRPASQLARPNPALAMKAARTYAALTLARIKLLEIAKR